MKIWKNQTYSPTIPVISEKWAKGNSQSHSFILLPTSSIAFAAGIGRRLGGKIVAMFYKWGIFYSCYRFHEISSFSYFNICWFLFPVVKKFLTVISFKKFSFWIELLIYWNNRGEGFFFENNIIYFFSDWNCWNMQLLFWMHPETWIFPVYQMKLQKIEIEEIKRK